MILDINNQSARPTGIIRAGSQQSAINKNAKNNEISL